MPNPHTFTGDPFFEILLLVSKINLYFCNVMLKSDYTK